MTNLIATQSAANAIIALEAALSHVAGVGNMTASVNLINVCDGYDDDGTVDGAMVEFTIGGSMPSFKAPTALEVALRLIHSNTKLSDATRAMTVTDYNDGYLLIV